jgi:hypothetical protein
METDKIYTLQREELLRCAPDKKSEANSNALIQILQKHPDGITITQICKLIPMTRPTAAKHLEKLVALQEARKEIKEISELKVAFFYPIGKVRNEKEVELGKFDGKTIFTFSIVENESGRYFYIKEIEKDDLRGEAVKGAIMIKENNLIPLIEQLHSYAAKVSKTEPRK